MKAPIREKDPRPSDGRRPTGTGTDSGPSHPARRVSPATTEPLARGFIGFLGGPVGRFAEVGRSRWWTPLRTLIFTALVFLSFGFLSKANCIQGARGEDGTLGIDWSGNRQYVSACYNDLVPLFAGRGLDVGGFPYAWSWQEGDLTRYLEYPVLTGLFQGAMGWLTRLTWPLVDALPGNTLPQAGWYFALTALALSALWVLTIRIVAELAGNRIWDTILVAASPLVIVHAFTNWDIPSIAAVAAAMLAVKRGHPLWAGVLIGAGTAFKLWPLYILGAYLVLAVRGGKLRPFLGMLGTAVVTWLAVNLPVMLAYPAAWNEFLRLNSERGWEWTTIWAVISRETGWSGFDSGPGDPVILNAVTFLLFAAACLAIAAFGLWVERRPRVAELVFLIVACFLLLNKVWSPQYSLWLVVPAVLALPRWRLLLTWMAVDMLVWPMVMWHMLGAENNGIPGQLLDVVILTRDGLIVAMIVLVVRQMMGRSPDKVRAAHDGRDPLAGPFGEEDAFTLRPRRDAGGGERREGSPATPVGDDG
ncbi:glycosyltransferase family 87 protein [Corynebacterium halotolerans]|uniref:Integral membrane protein n=1 Tax=Corynebacterium halotolerans YIM 70093 = DSM 44683 TaxID=1121362 RepID=M1NW36_9CORY|nr:glycosyltransferase 87 family protein [Corynebacterium halotolerans]AGF73692.1 hypothetical protein A605_13480 [Corynebacterium halotolerans YIM 70093 = DSM 44683]